MKRLLYILFVFLGISCASPTVKCPAPPRFDTVGGRSLYLSLSADISNGLQAWEREFRSHGVAGPLLFITVHGADHSHRWTACPDLSDRIDVDGMVKAAQQRNRGFKIVLISCNPGGYTVHEPGVYYARKVVSSIPHATPDGCPDAAITFEEFTYSGGNPK